MFIKISIKIGVGYRISKAEGANLLEEEEPPTLPHFHPKLAELRGLGLDVQDGALILQALINYTVTNTKSVS